jgi:hypothetical protein
MTPNRKAERHKNYLKRRATMTPEQLAAERAYQREYERERRAAMTPEELAADNAYKRKHRRKWLDAMTTLARATTRLPPESQKAMLSNRDDIQCFVHCT